MLTGLSALVTGAVGGIGRAVAAHFHSLGATVAVHSRERDDPRAAVLVAELGDRAFAVHGDVVDAAAAIVERCVRLAGRLDILVNNAGVQPVGALLDLTSDDVAEVMRVNVGGVAAMTAAAARAMVAADRRGGAICNVASIEAFGAPSMHSHYVASKAAVVAHTRAAAVELGPSGIRVNAVAPGLIERPGIGDAWPEGVSRWTAACPLGRLGRGEDIARAIAFLVGPDSAWITGACLAVDGGVSAGSPW